MGRKATKPQKEFLQKAFTEYLSYLDKGQGLTDEASQDIEKYGLLVIENLPAEMAKDFKERHQASGGVYLPANVTEPLGELEETSIFKNFDKCSVKPNNEHAGAIIHLITAYSFSYYPVFHFENNPNEPIKYNFRRSTFSVSVDKINENIFLTALDYVLSELSNATETDQLPEYSNISNTELGRLIKKTLNAPQKLESYRKSSLKKDYDELLGKMTITYTGSNKSSETYVLSIDNFKKMFHKQVRNGAKVFTYLLKEQNEQKTPELTFMLSDLVGENAPYKSLDTAYRGLDNILSRLQKIIARGEAFERGKSKQILSSPIVPLYKLSYKSCTVTLHPYFRESPYFTLLPSWAFALTDRNFMFIDYIYNMARQHTKEIKETGGFNVSLEAIRVYMGLPSPKDTQHHTEDIINPIDEAMEAVEDMQREKGRTDLKLKPMNCSYKNVSEYLQGFLRVELNQEATDYFNSIKPIKRIPRKAKTTDS